MEATKSQEKKKQKTKTQNNRKHHREHKENVYIDKRKQSNANTHGKDISFKNCNQHS